MLTVTLNLGYSVGLHMSCATVSDNGQLIAYGI